jgi:hypothetical protein
MSNFPFTTHSYPLRNLWLVEMVRHTKISKYRKHSSTRTVHIRVSDEAVSVATTQIMKVVGFYLLSLWIYLLGFLVASTSGHRLGLHPLSLRPSSLLATFRQEARDVITSIPAHNNPIDASLVMHVRGGAVSGKSRKKMMKVLLYCDVPYLVRR